MKLNNRGLQINYVTPLSIEIDDYSRSSSNENKIVQIGKFFHLTIEQKMF